MKALEEKILAEGQVYPGNILKVSSFLNHQLDVDFLMSMGEEISRLYADTEIDKILTIEASGIAIAVAAAAYMHVPVVFAKKNKTTNILADVYSSKVESYTHREVYQVVVSKEHLHKGEKILIIDDFLAIGNALNGLMDIVGQAGGTTQGVAIAIEKGFQGGGDALRKSGVRVESLAIVDSMTDDSVKFRQQ
ncbi:MAG: xanthine phosphoribosyltransferase [Acutalibacteraceae bacterium]|nr:xanthine phosphoribosyltransferase [Acutalibacteraceae bacterium]